MASTKQVSLGLARCFTAETLFNLFPKNEPIIVNIAIAFANFQQHLLKIKNGQISSLRI